jgi:hypothetical protein
MLETLVFIGVIAIQFFVLGVICGVLHFFGVIIGGIAITVMASILITGNPSEWAFLEINSLSQLSMCSAGIIGLIAGGFGLWLGFRWIDKRI